MIDPDLPPPADSLKDRLARAQTARREIEGANDKAAERYKSVGGAGLALRLATELVGSVLVGLALGYLIDWWFKTSPLFLLIMFAFGVAAGVLGGIRAYRNFNDELAAQVTAQAGAAKDGKQTP